MNTVTSTAIPVLPQPASSVPAQPSATAAPGATAATQYIESIQFSAVLSTAIVRDATGAVIPQGVVPQAVIPQAVVPQAVVSQSGSQAETQAEGAVAEGGVDTGDAQVPAEDVPVPDATAALDSVMALAAGAQMTIPAVTAPAMPQPAAPVAATAAVSSVATSAATVDTTTPTKPVVPVTGAAVVSTSPVAPKSGAPAAEMIPAAPPAAPLQVSPVQLPAATAAQAWPPPSIARPVKAAESVLATPVKRATPSTPAQPASVVPEPVPNRPIDLQPRAAAPVSPRTTSEPIPIPQQPAVSATNESVAIAASQPGIAPAATSPAASSVVAEPAAVVVPVRFTGGEAVLAGRIAENMAQGVSGRQAGKSVAEPASDNPPTPGAPIAMQAPVIHSAVKSAANTVQAPVSSAPVAPSAETAASPSTGSKAVKETTSAPAPKQPGVEPEVKASADSMLPSEDDARQLAAVEPPETSAPGTEAADARPTGVAQPVNSTDMRHTNPLPQTGGSYTAQVPATTASTVTPETAQTLSQAASGIAASTQDNQQSADRNVATERSTTVSLGSAVAGSSALKTAQEAAPGDPGAEHGKERQNTEKSENPNNSVPKAAAPESKFEAAPASAPTAPTEPPLKAAPSRSTEPSTLPNHASHERVRVVEQVAQKLDTMRLANGRQEMTVHLRPDHLGDLRLTIIADRHEVVTRVVAETAAARDAVMEGREQLGKSLEQKGYSLQGLDVSLSNGGQRPFVPYQPAPDQPLRQHAAARQPAESGAANMPAAVARTSSAPIVNGRLDYEA